MFHLTLKEIFSKFNSRKSRNVSNFSKVFSIFISIFIVWVGIWKIQNDMKRVLSISTYNSELWLEIIESLDILIFITMVIVVSLENIVKVKNNCHEMEGTTFIQNEELSSTALYIALLFYGGLYFLLSTELDFIKVTVEITTYYRNIHFLLKDVLNPVKPLYWIGCEMKSDRTFHIEDCINLHWVVCKYVHKINQEYSLRLLSIIICIFYKLMFIPYISSLNLIKAYSENLINELFHASLWLFHFAEMLLLACSADLTSREAKITQYVLCEYAEYHLNDEDIDIIETQHNNLCVHKAEFKVFNIFKLDKPMVLLIFGAVVTYLAIFIQLQDVLNISQIFSSLKN